MSSKTERMVTLTASKNLVTALKTAAGVTPKRVTKHVLESVYVSFHGEEVSINATDLDTWYHQRVSIPDLAVMKPLTLLVHRDAIKSMKPGMVIAFGETSYQVGAITYPQYCSVEEFPKFPELQSDAHKTPLDSQYFDDLADCAVSASDGEIRPVLTTVCHRSDYLAATDGLRLLKAEQSTRWSLDIKIPAQRGKLLQKVFSGCQASVMYDEFYAGYQSETCEVTIRQVQGAYPDVTRLFPPTSTALCRVAITDSQPWLEACDTALIVYKQTPKDHRDSNKTLTMVFDGGRVTLSAQAEQKFETTVDAKVSGTPSTLMCNAQHLRDALVQVGDGAELQVFGAKQPFILAASHRKALVSPIKPREEK